MFITILNNYTITSSSSWIVDGLNSSEIILSINILNTPTGTNPSLIFTVADIDPIDQTTIIGNQISSSAFTSTTTTTLKLRNSLSDTIKISWTLAGTSSPTFTGVNVSIIQKDNIEIPNVATISVASNISASASNVTLLASNQNRLGASFQNDSSNILYLKLGSSSSLTSYTVRMISNSYYELPFFYNGIITGIWDGTNGACRVCELS